MSSSGGVSNQTNIDQCKIILFSTSLNTKQTLILFTSCASFLYADILIQIAHSVIFFHTVLYTHIIKKLIIIGPNMSSLYINTCTFKKDFINNYKTKTDPCLIKSYWTNLKYSCNLANLFHIKQDYQSWIKSFNCYSENTNLIYQDF